MTWKDIEITQDDIYKINKIKSKARFYADEDVGEDLVEKLQSVGFNVVTAKECNLLRHDDSDHFQFAYRNNRILLTYDNDFLDNNKFPFNVCPGIIIFSRNMNNNTKKEIIEFLSIIERDRELWRYTKLEVSMGIYIKTYTWDKEYGKVEINRYWIPSKGKAKQWIDDD